MNILIVLWWVGVFVIFWAMLGYPVSLSILNKLIKRENAKDYSYEPTVDIMVTAHNEEKVIEQKLQNLLDMDYPSDKLNIFVASDFSTDKTDDIVKRFATEHSDRRIQIHRSEKYLGKTNAQNETQEFCQAEILIMTDANAIFEKNAIREIVASFVSPDIAYVSGRLCYLNADGSNTATYEGFYWRLDLVCREIESRIQTITAGNGAIYAVRNREYVKIPNIESHDSGFPLIYALKKKRAIYNPDAVAYEKAGEVNEDEFKRKVRMNRRILNKIAPDIRLFNIFAYRWFAYFYFGHRTCRYLLWLMHFLVFAINVPLVFCGVWWKSTMILQLLFYITAIIGWFTKNENRIVRAIFYYCMTVTAQWKGVINMMTGNSRSTWDKAESTR